LHHFKTGCKIKPIAREIAMGFVPAITRSYLMIYINIAVDPTTIAAFTLLIKVMTMRR
jgi:hypothetical protein